MAVLSRQETYNTVIAIIAEKLNIEQTAIQGGSTLPDLGADSLDIVEIIMKIEEQCNIAINDEDAEKLSTVDMVVDYVHRLRTA